MHGIMEGPGEELTVAAIATEGLDDGHPHLNGVGTALLENGANGAPSPPPPSKDVPLAAAAGQPSPPASPPATAVTPTPASPSPPAAPEEKEGEKEKEKEKEEEEEKEEEKEEELEEEAVASPAPTTPTSPAADIPVETAVEAADASAAKEAETEEQDATTATLAGDDLPTEAGTPEPEATQTPSATSPTASPTASPTTSPAASPTTSPAASPAPTKASEESPPSDFIGETDSKENKVSEIDSVRISLPSGENIGSVVKTKISKDVTQDSDESTTTETVCKEGEVSVKVERDNLSNCDEAPSSSDDQKEMSIGSDTHQDEEVGGSSESETSLRDNSCGGSEEFRMDVDLASTDVKAEVNEDQEKSTDSGIVSEHPSKKPSQKRAHDEDASSGQAKKQCLPDIVCGDANALDLSGIKKKENKEPKIALKPQSLLLSKLQGTSEVEKPKKDTYRSDESRLRLGEPSLPARTVRRRSSRDDKETRVNYQRRSSDSNASRALERDQVLREMRTRVRSSYKERERVAKEDNSLLRDLLEPERDTYMTDFVDTATQSGGISELDRVSAALEAEIIHLSVEINAKEAEWNELIRKKKLKEELALRIHRRKQVLALGGIEDDLARRSSFEENPRSETKRDSNVDARLDRRHDHYREIVPKTGEELLAAALRLGSRNVEDYHHRSSSSSPLAVRIQARANELLTGSTPTVERKSTGPLPGLSHMQTPSLLQSQLTKPTEMSPNSSQSQFLLQHLQRQRVLMGAVSNAGSACQLSPSVSLSAIPTPTSTSSALNASLPSTAVHNKSMSRADKQASGASVSRNQRPILPKPSIATSGGHVVSDSSLDGSGKGIIGEGRQGPIIDVQSIIADYRSQHPENVPRRGRRMKPSGMVSDSIMASARPGSSSGGALLSMSLPALGSGSHVRTGAGGSTLHGGPVDLSELGFVLTSGAGSDGPSRPSSTESSLSGAPSQINTESGSGMSFKDVLVQFAKMTNASEQSALSSQGALLARPPPPPYPEVTLHPVIAQTPVPSPIPAASTPTTSLLHGILTKPNNQSSNNGSQSHAKPTTFSPTLARLLTAPERISSASHHANPASVLPHYQTSAASSYGATGPVLLSDLLSGGSSKKARSELTITPVSATSGASNAPTARTKSNDDVVVLDGEDGGDMNGDDGDASDSDERRLVIDEGDHGENGESSETSGRLDRSKNSVPHCQGCNERDAEFVCAGCQRQWYCSRECQIAAWDEHSEQCFPASSD